MLTVLKRIKAVPNNYFLKPVGIVRPYTLPAWADIVGEEPGTYVVEMQYQSDFIGKIFNRPHPPRFYVFVWFGHSLDNAYEYYNKVSPVISNGYFQHAR